MDEELKPCPFCGGKPEQRNYIVEAVVHCTSCFAVIRRTHAPTVDTGIAASAEAWNARAALTPPEGYVLVPVEPTDDMIWAPADVEVGYPMWAGSRDGCTADEAKAIWTAMLAARPEVP